MNWLETFTAGKEAWTYLVAGELGLIFVILFKTVAEKRGPQWFDLWALVVYSIFVSTATVLVDTSPWLAFAIGLACQDLWPLLQKALVAAGPGMVTVLMRGLPTQTQTPVERTGASKNENENESEKTKLN